MFKENPQVNFGQALFLMAIIFIVLPCVLIAQSEPDQEVPEYPWQESVDLCKSLAKKTDHESFLVLLDFLQSDHSDVSSAASEALADRGQKKWANEFIAVIPKMRDGYKWFAHKALGRYPTQETLLFLADEMKSEFQKIRDNKFDHRNYFYCHRSIDQIVQAIEEKAR